ncbi:quercetin dioxygenase-like cupin family protein [Silvibacterium bohemicum]|uniref:Quercetin dioxygenase-like cupin family protein n=1 Tax=Silvibacterium bohemicum TaxID=1577686 RepID=A0A841K258_9BACT|nr:cupin domain-containing protein [Silvibacterium bohemicum]MBB6144334.1 quercetin dioxygenase-like cupin family protein [Silvibacterium bohemicum]
MNAFVLQPIESYHLLGELVEVVLTGEATNNATSIIIETTPPGGGPPPHIHQNEDETLTVLAGEFEVLSHDSWLPLKTGEIAFLPKGTLHTFRNSGKDSGRIAAAFFPAGMEKFFGELADGLTLENAAEKILTIGEKYKVKFFLSPPQ